MISSRVMQKKSFTVNVFCVKILVGTYTMIGWISHEKNEMNFSTKGIAFFLVSMV